MFVPDTSKTVQTSIFFLVLLFPTLIAFFLRNAFARLYFAVISATGSAFAILLALLPGRNGLAGLAVGEGARLDVAFGLVVLALFIVWRSLIRYSYALFMSIIPIGRGRAYRQQVIQTIKADAERVRVARARDEAFDRSASKSPFVHFVTIGGLAFFTGQFLLVFTVIAMIRDDVRFEIRRGRFCDALRLATHFKSPVYRDESWPDIWRSGLTLFAMVLPAYCSLLFFGYLWHRWQRSRIVIRDADSSRPIPSGGILLLRHSRDDVMRIPKRNWTLSRLPFMAFEFNFTFEELIAKRLSFVGPLYSLSSNPAPLPWIDQLRARVERVAGRRSSFVRCVLGTSIQVRRRFRRKYPPRGTIPFRTDTNWQQVLRRSLPGARALVVILGAVKNGLLVSPNLDAELGMIRDGHLGKTIFLVPPLSNDRELRKRWDVFLDFLSPPNGSRKSFPKARRVLAVCFHDGVPVVITGSKRTEFFYESALDVAGAFAGGSPDKAGLMLVRRKSSRA